MASISTHMLGNLKTPAVANGNGNSNGNGSLHAVAASLRLRRKHSVVVDTSSADAPPPVPPAETARRRHWKNPFSPPKHPKGSEADDSDAEAAVASPSLRPAMMRAASVGGPGAPPQMYLPLPPQGRRPTMPREMSVPETTMLDSVSLESPPHVAVRYGDTIRLFARSKYVSAAESGGGYVGTFEAGRRFLASKNPPKQGELACLPPVLTSGGAPLFRESSFTIVSTCGREAGAPVSYGDVVVLVDDKGRVWNNKIGVGPTTLNGYFGPREHNLPGEMYLSFYQLDEDGGASSSDSDSDDDGDGFLSLSSIARTTKTMAETTFGKPTQMEMDLAAAALRTMGRVVYYGDKNVIIDVADSNRLRSKFNRVVTHYRKSDELAVQGGYLRCDGKGKPIMFELHGPPLATVQSIDVYNQSGESEESLMDGNGGKGAGGRDDDDDDDDDDASEASPSLRVSSSLGGSIAVGRPLEIRDVQPTTVVSLLFSDGGAIKIPCTRFLEAAEKPFFRIVLGGERALRLQLAAVKSVRSIGKVSIKKTLLDTYRELVKLYGGVVVVSSAAAFVLSKLLRLTISLPAMYLGGVTVLGVFLLELFYPGRVLKSHDAKPSPLDPDAEDSQYLGDWKLSILSIEASPTERLACASSPSTELARKQSSRAMKVPMCFVFAENGNMTKAAERYEVTLAWRKEMNADTVLTTPQTFYSSIKQNYHQYLHKTDRLGHPVYYEKIGNINIKQLQKLGITQDDLLRHYLFAMEFTLKYAANKICSCEACAASETQKLFIVLDARGIGMRDLSGEGAEFIRKCTGIMQRHYPQRSYKIFFVNVPSWFGMAWKGIKPLLNETTRAKTNILTENDTPQGLLEFIDAENLPVEYGGTCSCPGGCEENSAYQILQKKLVESVISCRPFAPEDLADVADRPSSDGVDSEAENGKIRDSASSNGMTEMSTTMGVYGGDNVLLLPPGLFRDEVLLSGYLLKRPMKHNNFTPIWNRRFFILHPDSIRFGKVPRSEIYQIVQLTAATTVRKTQKGNNTFELVTPLMAQNGHSLVLFAPTPVALNKWVDSIQQVIDKLAGKSPPVPSPVVSDVEGNVSSPGDAKQLE